MRAVGCRCPAPAVHHQPGGADQGRAAAPRLCVHHRVARRDGPGVVEGRQDRGPPRRHAAGCVVRRRRVDLPDPGRRDARPSGADPGLAVAARPVSRAVAPQAPQGSRPALVVARRECGRQAGGAAGVARRRPGQSGAPARQPAVLPPGAAGGAVRCGPGHPHRPAGRGHPAAQPHLRGDHHRRHVADRARGPDGGLAQGGTRGVHGPLPTVPVRLPPLAEPGARAAWTRSRRSCWPPASTGGRA